MNLMKPYKSLVGYLERFTICQVGRLHIRIHDIKTHDGTPFLHSHPFHYISIVLRGGYTEKIKGVLKRHRIGAILLRSAATLHRITEVQPGTKTLFIAWSVKGEWKLVPDDQVPDGWVHYEAGLYTRELYGRTQYCKFDHYWFRSHDNEQSALNEIEPSIDQLTSGVLVRTFNQVSDLAVSPIGSS